MRNTTNAALLARSAWTGLVRDRLAPR